MEPVSESSAPLASLKIAVFEEQYPKAAALMRALLEPGEKISLVTTAWRSSFVDDIFLGIPTLLSNRTLVVGTERRLLLIRCGGRDLVPRGYVNEVPRTALLAAMAVPLMSIFTTGGTIRLIGVPASGKRALTQDFDPEAKPTGRPRHLCPACFVPHERHLPRCWRCGARFRTPWKAALRSLVLPGLGDAYLGSFGVGVMTALTTGFLWLNVIAFLRAASKVSGAQAEAVAATASLFLALALGAHVLSGLVSGVRGLKGLIAMTAELPAAPVLAQADWPTHRKARG
jgi:hypothetical protein